MESANFSFLFYNVLIVKIEIEDGRNKSLVKQNSRGSNIPNIFVANFDKI